MKTRNLPAGGFLFFMWESFIKKQGIPKDTLFHIQRSIFFLLTDLTEDQHGKYNDRGHQEDTQHTHTHDGQSL